MTQSTFTAHNITVNKDGSLTVELKKYANDGHFVNACDVVSADGNTATIICAEDYPELFAQPIKDLGVWTKISQDDVESSLRNATYEPERAQMGATEKQVKCLAKLMFDAGDNMDVKIPNRLTKNEASNMIAEYTK